MAVYEEKLPAMHISGDELRGLEEAITRNTTDSSLSITIEYQGFEYQLSSAEDIIEDFDLPDMVSDFTISLFCREGRIKIDASLLSNARLRISGEKEWVRRKKQDIQRQISNNKKLARSHVDKLVYGIYAFQWVGVFILNLMNSGSSDPQFSLGKAIIGVGFLFLFIMWPFLLIRGIDFVYPKYLLKRDESIHYRPRLKKAVETVIVLLGIIGGIATISSLL